MGDNSNSAAFDRLKDRVHLTEAVATAEVELLTDDVGEKLTRLDRDAEVTAARRSQSPSRPAGLAGMGNAPFIAAGSPVSAMSSFSSGLPGTSVARPAAKNGAPVHGVCVD